MDARRFQRLKDLVGRALALPITERLAFLQGECGDDDDLVRDARELLSQEDPDSDDLTVAAVPGVRDLSGTRIGPYTISQQIGEGGMGVVYLAEQSAPLRRRVALKVIKVGMDTREVITRFESERQALALMDHANIAKVLDAGATDAGRPYFVMEYIAGVPLNRYCREHDLGLRRRLDLFIKVCRGVHHAHQKGVIHRDLKPGNILVTEEDGKPVPKIIDFGVAKATAQNLAARTYFTQLGRIVGTPEYMSPEQADQETLDIDTRSDVFSLGVILYELLAGVLPIGREELLRAGYEKIATIIKERVPSRPSTRITGIDTDRQERTASSTPRTSTWARRVKGDLDWITMKALEKDRDRRYESAVELAADLERHLENEPVLAGPPSRIYRTRKFVRRHRAGVLVFAFLTLCTAFFVTWQAAQSRIIAQERDMAVANQRLSLARGLVETDPTTAVAYALASLEVRYQPAAHDVIRQAVARGPLRDELPRGNGNGNPLSCDVSADGRLCAVIWSHTGHPSIGIYDLSDYSMRLLTAEAESDVYEVMFNSDGSHVIANAFDYGAAIHVWRVADGAHLWHVPAIGEFCSSCLFRSTNPRRIFISGNNIGEPTVWHELDLYTGSLTRLGRSRGAMITDGAGHEPAIDRRGEWIVDFVDRRVYLQRVEDLDSDRAVLLGEHEVPVSSVAIDHEARRAVSVGIDGHIMVWDLMTRPPALEREYRQDHGHYHLEFDHTGQRFFTSWASATVTVYDLATSPPRLPQRLLDRSHWAHDGAFLPDGSLVTSRNGLSAPVAFWPAASPITWSLDAGVERGRGLMPMLSPDGETLTLWLPEGDVVDLPLVAGTAERRAHLGRTDGWAFGINTSIRQDADRRRIITDNSSGKARLIDLESGEVRTIRDFAPDQFLIDMSPGGNRACFYYFDGAGTMRYVDLDRQEVLATLTLGPDLWESLLLAGDSELMILWADRLVRLDPTTPTAAPDTLWLGDASGGGKIVEGGGAVVLRDASMAVTLIDLQDAEETRLGTTPPGALVTVACDRDLGLVALGGWWQTVEVFDIEGGRHWQLPAIGEGRAVTADLAFDPHGRWLLSNHHVECVAWTLPLDPLFADQSPESFLAAARQLTNIRVVPDDGATDGFRITNTAER